MALSDELFGLLGKGVDVWAQKELAEAGLTQPTDTPNTGSNGVADQNAAVEPVAGPPVSSPTADSQNVVIAGITFNKGLLTLSVIAFIAYVVLKGAKG